MSELTPYPFQIETVYAAERPPFNGRVLLGHDMGLGKTPMALWIIKRQRIGQTYPVLIVCPKILRAQWTQFIKTILEVESVVLETRTPFDSAFTGQVALINSEILSFWRPWLEEQHFQTIVLDECFPFHTKVHTNQGLLSIGEIVEQNRTDLFILSCNTANSELEWKTVKSVFKLRPKNAVVRVYHSAGYVDCTDNHELWTEEHGYVKAASLQKNNHLWMVQGTRISSKKRKIHSKILQQKLCNVLRKQSTRKKSKVKSPKTFDTQRVPLLSEGISSTKSRKEAKRKTPILQSQLLSKAQAFTQNQRIVPEFPPSRTKSKDWSKESSSISQNEVNESRSSISRENSKGVGEAQGSDIFRNSRRERLHNRTSKTSAQRTKIGRRISRVSNLNTPSKRMVRTTGHIPKILTDKLLCGHRNSGVQVSYRNRRRVTPNKETKIHRQEERQSLVRVRVDRVEVLKRAGDERSTGSGRRGGYVYCIEVEDNHNFFANGVLVSNCHYFSNPKAKRTQTATLLIRQTPFALPLTGTPVENRPMELFEIIHALHPKAWPDRNKFGHKYCGASFGRRGWMFNGSSNEDELRIKLRATSLIRYLKKDVLHELPDKVRSIIPVELRHQEEYQKAQDDFLGWIRDTYPDRLNKAVRSAALMRSGHLLRLCARLKLKSVVDWINYRLEQSTDEKIIVYAIHRKCVEALKRKLNAKSVMIYGKVSNNERRDALLLFEKDRNTRLLIANIAAAGVGLNLVHAKMMCVTELPWKPGALLQLEDRICRIGQDEKTFINYFIGVNTIEELVSKLLQRKSRVITSVLDRNTDNGEKDFDLYDMICEDMQKKTWERKHPLLAR